jgi:hypothetical protein
MSKVFFFGASIEYGVGGESGGWADMVKQSVHRIMFADNGVGEKHQVYIFAKPGADINFVVNSFESQLDDFGGDNQEVIAVVSVGMNDAKAKNGPNNFLSNVEEYKAAMSKLLTKLKKRTDKIVCVGFTPVDETKTTPKNNPLTGDKTFHYNHRVEDFNKGFAEVTRQSGATFIDLFSQAESIGWRENYLYADGIHPNSLGHKWIFEQVRDIIESHL